MSGTEKYEQLAANMRNDWDRRVRHDYRFWMTESHMTDEQMWQSGERDFELIANDIHETESKVMLDVGCGVGRLLRAAERRFKSVIGLDISKEALAKAREFFGDNERVKLILGNGYELEGVKDSSVDVAISFDAIASMPIIVIANYLVDMHRVLRANGIVRLQLYLGPKQPVRENDALHLHCFEQQNIEKAMTAAGFEVEYISELELPTHGSTRDLGITAATVSLKRIEGLPVASHQIAQLLSPNGEGHEAEVMEEVDLESSMSLAYPKELTEVGEYEKAQQAIEYAAAFNQTASLDVRDLWDRIGSKLDSGHTAEASVCQTDMFEQNLVILRERFADVAERVLAAHNLDLEVQSTPDGPVLMYKGLCLDHLTKPVSAAKNWAKRLTQEPRIQDCQQIAVYGFGCGYHVEALTQLTQQRIGVYEAQPEVIAAAMRVRDLRSCFQNLSFLAVGEQDISDQVDEYTEIGVRPQSQAVALEAQQRIRSQIYSVRGATALHPQMAVLGPVQGGTLPILAYTTRALMLEKQRVRDIDMSGFAHGYHAVGNIIKNELLQATAQGQYVDLLSKFVLDSLTEKPVDILLCMAQAPITLPTLEELRRRGVITVLWFVEDYLRFRTWQSLAPYFDFIFTIQKEGCQQAIRAAGCSEVHYLPTACDPFIHMPQRLSIEDQHRYGSEISFMGAGYHNRQQMFASLAHLPFKIWGTEWPTCRPFDKLVQEGGRRMTPEEYVKVFNGSKININLHSSTERDGVDPEGDFVNPRTFELAACGAFQLIDHRRLLPEVFNEGEEIITFADTNELKEKISYYLDHEEERTQIASRARQRALKEHTYQRRLKEMLGVIYGSQFERLRQREKSSPWSRLLERSKRFPELHERCQAAFQRGEEPGLDGLLADIVTGKGQLSETEMILLFLYHVSKQIIRMKMEEMGEEKWTRHEKTPS